MFTVALEHDLYHLLLEQAIGMLTEAIRIDPHHWKFHFFMALLLAETGQVFWRRSDLLAEFRLGKVWAN